MRQKFLQRSDARRRLEESREQTLELQKRLQEFSRAAGYLPSLFGFFPEIEEVGSSLDYTGSRVRNASFVASWEPTPSDRTDR